MAKLYPPLIDGTIPAFGLDGGTAKIVVPFSYNRAVGKSEVKSFHLKIKTITGTSVLVDGESSAYDPEKQTVTFIFDNTDNIFLVGQYYKIQMAFVDETNTIGYYSTVGVIKCTSVPDVSIIELQTGTGMINHHTHNYTLSYSQENGDASEKLYSSQFILLDNNKNIIADSGEILHNVNDDESANTSCESYTIPQELKAGVNYILYVNVTTSNGLVVKTPNYHVTQVATVDSGLQINLTAENNYDDGFISLKMENLNEDEKVLGTFYVSRAASNDNYIWRELFSFSITGGMASNLWEDFTVEQGVTYKYSIQEFNGYIYSNRIISNSVLADFEDAFLFDGERQLKIRYNPKISSFKKDIPENKIETIGSQFPFIFRNGRINYKEFPISGLISYQMDENEIFTTKKTLGLEDVTCDLTSNNIFAERNFKINVLDWLTNGKNKLFRSPAEGNYIVRLLNVSLSPTDSLGRMLHTFQSTAYEVAEFNYDNLLSTKLLEIKDFVIASSFLKTVIIGGNSKELDAMLSNARQYYQSGIPIIISGELKSRLINADSSLADFIVPNEDGYQINITNKNSETVLIKLEKLINAVTHVTNSINDSPIYSIDVRDMYPGTILEFIDEKGKKQQIIIGATGAYKATFESPVYQLNINTRNLDSIDQVVGTITYEFKEVPMNTFGTVSDYDIYEVPCHQFIGPPSLNYYSSQNIIKAIQDIKKSIAFISMLRFFARDIKEIFVKDEKYYWTMDCQDEPININNLNPIYLYAICYPREDYTYHWLMNEQYYVDAKFRSGYYMDKDGNKKDVFTGTYLSKYVIPLSDGTQYKIIPESLDLFQVNINNQKLDIRKTRKYVMNDLSETFSSITIGEGVICEIGYQQKISNYAIESQAAYGQNYYKLIYETKKKEWESLKDGTFFNSAGVTVQDAINKETALERDIKISYNGYIDVLEKTLDSLTTTEE